MHIECLEFFQKIAETKSISKVADSSHISQSALSQQMQKLEETLGYKLFTRSNRGVNLTDAGEIVLKYTDNMIRTYNKMLEGLQQKEKNKFKIKIEADFTFATYCLPCALLRMKDKYPGHDYNLVSNSSAKIEQDVLNDICEIGFVSHKSSEISLNYEKMINENVVLISLPNYDIPEKFNLKEILDHKLIMIEGECIINENLSEALNKIGHDINDLNVIANLETTEAIKTLVLKGFGIAFVPYSSIKKELYEKELKISRVKDFDLDYIIYILTKNNNKLSQSEREFIEGIKSLGYKMCC